MSIKEKLASKEASLVRLLPDASIQLGSNGGKLSSPALCGVGLETLKLKGHMLGLVHQLILKSGTVGKPIWVLISTDSLHFPSHDTLLQLGFQRSDTLGVLDPKETQNPT